jgi:polygalacturonase
MNPCLSPCMSTKGFLHLGAFLAAAWLVTAVAFAAAPTIASARRYVVTDHGAVGDGTTVNTKVLQAAIDRCAADGGGVIVVPKGTFLSGALFFKQGVDLFVEKDAILKSTIAMADFPPIYSGINVTSTTRTVGVIHGLAGSPIQGVTFENCRISAQRGLRIDDARAVDLTGLKLDVKLQSAHSMTVV